MSDDEFAGRVALVTGELAGRVPVGRLGRPSEVADLALAVLRNGYLTNQVIGIDGGIHPR
jgi:3-oxoacyl-[acyl-carrier protein] reductase